LVKCTIFNLGTKMSYMHQECKPSPDGIPEFLKFCPATSNLI
jgi:hypothetical protein